jgi:hypothetical protein
MQRLELILQKSIRQCNRECLLHGRSSNDFYTIHDKIKRFKSKLRKYIHIYRMSELPDELADDLSEIYSLINASTKLTSHDLSRVKHEFQLIYKDITGIPLSSDIKNGDELRNINSYEYLRYIAYAFPENLISTNTVFRKIAHLTSYNYSNASFGNLYTQFLTEVERLIESGELDNHRQQLAKAIRAYENEIEALKTTLKKYPRNQALKRALKAKQRMLAKNIKELELYDELIDRIYKNQNLALVRSHEFVNPVLQRADVKQTSSKAEKEIRKHLIGGNSLRSFINHYIYSFDDMNDTTPQQIGSTTGQISATISPEFKPQFTTSQASVRHYEYKTETDPLELRFGTQGQFVDYIEKSSSTFKAWLAVNKKRNPQKPITHIYFNNLPRNRKPIFDAWPFNLHPKVRESKLTKAMEDLGNENGSVIAVITLPADQGLMSKALVNQHDKTISYLTAYNEMLAIANGTSQAEIQDFYISPRIKALIYKGHENQVLRGLLDKSFSLLGFKSSDMLSPAEKQAVFFHFIKFELTDHIINELKPLSFNMACKDAIDRGGASSAYYNLLKSIERGTPMSQAEFEQALHGAPTLVKGRSMNHHTRLIWNAIDAYISGFDKELNGYDLALMSKNSNVKNHTIEFKCTPQGLQYRLTGKDKLVKDGLIPWNELPKSFPKTNEQILAHKNDLLPIILKKTSKAGHTRPELPDWLRTWHKQHALKGSKVAHIRKLEKYVAKIHKNSNSFFYTKSDKKRDALAVDLLNAVGSARVKEVHPNTAKPTIFHCSQKHWNRLNNGKKMRKIITGLQSNNLIQVKIK